MRAAMLLSADVSGWLANARDVGMLAAILIFLLTLTLVIWQPRGLPIGYSALLGAAAALMAGVVHPHDIPVVWGMVWNATLTFIAIIVVSLLLDEAGFFEWAALHVARWGGGNGRRLYTLVILLGAAVSAFFANDGAALILTPIVVAMLSALGFGSGAMLAFVMAAGFIADTASLPLLISNLVNIVTADYFDIGFSRYAAVMVPVNAVSIVASLGVLHLYFRRNIPKAYDRAALRDPALAIRCPATFRASWWVLGGLLGGVLLLEPRGVPVSVVASIAAAGLLLVAWRAARVPIAPVIRHAPWQIVLFSLGMYLVVYGLRNQGLTDYLAALLSMAAQHGVWGAAFATGLLSALLSSVMNNLPTVLIGALAVDATDTGGAVREAMIYANVIGSDLGPKITPIGSLATLLWLHVLARHKVHVGWGYYFRCGIVLTVPVLLITLAGLAWRLA